MSQTPKKPGARPFCILVADDEPDILTLFREILDPTGARGSERLSSLASSLFGERDQTAVRERFVLTTASQGEAAVAAVKDALDKGQPFAVVFLDVRMPPGEGGVAAAERIRALDSLVQIVFITAYSDIDPGEISRRIPPRDKLLYLQKPFHPQEIVQLAESLSAKWHAERSFAALHKGLETLVAARTRELAKANAKLTREMAERERVAGLIATAKAEWEGTFDSVQDLILILDGQAGVRRLNLALAGRLGLTPREAAGRPLAELLRSKEHPGAYFQELLGMCDGAFHTRELVIPALRGEFLVTASPLFTAPDKHSHTVLVLHDVTQRKALEARLRQSHKMEAIGTLAGGIAHDFNNILGIIMGFAEMSLEAAASEPAQARRLTHILEACQRAKDLVRQILTFSRQSGEEASPLRLGPLVKETMKLLSATLPKNIVIRESVAAGGDWIKAEPTHIQQVLMNLCANAAHAMREKGGELRVELSRVELSPREAAAHQGLEPGPHARLAVRDTGHGMAPEVAERIFDPFFTTKAPGEGTGMGLSVVHGIVKKYGGGIGVVSRPGAGTAFEVFFPQTSGPATAAGLAASGIAPRGRGRILAVDDEKALLELAREMLEGLGYTVSLAGSGAEALALFEADPGGFDAVFTDQTMPGMTGIELAGEIVKRRPGTPVILCTGYSESLTPEMAKPGGVAEFLLKPVLKQNLAEALKRATGKA